MWNWLARMSRLSFSTRIPALHMNSIKIWLAITRITFSPVCRDLCNNRLGSRQTELNVFSYNCTTELSRYLYTGRLILELG